ncbi:MAG: ABC transporter substrate-binding protein [Ardenticatenaceae bacterium]
MKKALTIGLLVALMSMLVVACSDSEPESSAPEGEAAGAEVQQEEAPATDGAQEEAPATDGAQGEAAATDGAQEGPIELVIWAEGNTQQSMSNDPEGAGRYGLFLKQQFEAQNPGVTVKMEYHGWDQELRQNLVNALLANTTPDVVVGENFFQQYAELGALVPLDQHIADIKDNLVEGTYKAAVYNGQIYGLSSFTGVFSFERNCVVVQAAGLDCNTPPQTWNELVAQSRAISQQGQGQYYGYTLQGPIGSGLGSIFRVAVYLAQADAPMCQDENCSQPWFNHPNAVPVMEFLREMNKTTPPGLTFNPDEGQIYSQLFQGISAYQIAGSWHVNWAPDAGCQDCRYSSIPKPANGQPASIIVGNAIYAVLAQSKHPEMAAKWVKFIASDGVQDLVHPVLGRLPSTRSALQKLRPNVDSATQAYIDELLNNPNLGILPQWRKEPQQMWTIYNDMLTKVLTTDTPVPQLLDEAQAAAEAIANQ